jgi:hypothetical protein
LALNRELAGKRGWEVNWGRRGVVFELVAGLAWGAWNEFVYGRREVLRRWKTEGGWGKVVVGERKEGCGQEKTSAD